MKKVIFIVKAKDGHEHVMDMWVTNKQAAKLLRKMVKFNTGR